jgi:hypothetical protein
MCGCEVVRRGSSAHTNVRLGEVCRKKRAGAHRARAGASTGRRTVVLVVFENAAPLLRAGASADLPHTGQMLSHVFGTARRGERRGARPWRVARHLPSS